MEITKAMEDVRRAFRLLALYQQSIVQLVHYMKGKFEFEGRLMGHKLYSRALSGVQDEHANQNVHAGMWGWDFLYGYMYEYYTGWRPIIPQGNGNIRMSFIQVSDDGYAISKEANSRIDIYNKDKKKEKYVKEEDSHSYIIMCFMYSNNKEEEDMNSIGCFFSKDDESKESDFIIKYLSGAFEKEEADESDFIIKYLPGAFEKEEEDGFYVEPKNGKDTHAIYVMKKYPIENFINQESTDNQIRDFKGFVNRELMERYSDMNEIFKM